jgi:hypothetical protein
VASFGYQRVVSVDLHLHYLYDLACPLWRYAVLSRNDSVLIAAVSIRVDRNISAPVRGLVVPRSAWIG